MDAPARVSLGKNVRGETRPGLSCGRSSLSIRNHAMVSAWSPVNDSKRWR